MSREIRLSNRARANRRQRSQQRRICKLCKSAKQQWQGRDHTNGQTGKRTDFQDDACTEWELADDPPDWARPIQTWRSCGGGYRVDPHSPIGRDYA